jgi:hypothetical protein
MVKTVCYKSELCNRIKNYTYVFGMAKYLFEEEGYDHRFLSEAKWFWIWKFEQMGIVVENRISPCGYCFKFDSNKGGGGCRKCPVSASDIRCECNYLYHASAETIFNLLRNLKRTQK